MFFLGRENPSWYGFDMFNIGRYRETPRQLGRLIIMTDLFIVPFFQRVELGGLPFVYTQYDLMDARISDRVRTLFLPS